LHLHHGPNELPELVNAPLKAIGLSQNQEKERLAFVFDEPIQKRAEVVESIKRHFEVGRQKADILLARFVREGLIVKNGKDRSQHCVQAWWLTLPLYRCVIYTHTR